MGGFRGLHGVKKHSFLPPKMVPFFDLKTAQIKAIWVAILCSIALLCVFVCICVYLCIFVYMCVYVCICMCICVYLCVFIYIFVYLCIISVSYTHLRAHET